ncbi:MAG: transcription termination/antitermination protein NusA [Nitrospinae bacterium]|nr:transcription termination/antitermination protein NusA [Nitrospinota bacterium]
MNLEALHIIEQISREKSIDKAVLIEAIESAVEAAAHKRAPEAKELHAVFDEATGEIKIFAEKTAVETVNDPHGEILLQDAVKIAPDARLGEHVMEPLTIENYGRIAAQLAKQVILQKVREAEIENVYKEFKDKKNDLVNGIVQRVEHGDLIVELGKAEGILPRREQVFRETFNRGDRIRAYVVDVRKTAKNALVVLSRTHTGLIQRLFELEVPEISEGMVEIKGIAREPNGRTKIAVKTNDRDIDAVGACVGMRGMRVQSIVQELRGEKIDIVEYSENPQEFIRNALSPAKVSRIIVNEAERSMVLIVADDQMSLAIGKKGQNVRLAAKLVKWKIDIKGESEAQSLLGQQPFGLTKKPATPETHFLDLVKTAKGLGEKVVPVLFSVNLNTAQDVVKQGIEGLLQLPGIGPKKAEAILNLAQSQLEEIARAEEKTAAEQEIPASAGPEGEPSGEEPEEDHEFPIEILVDVDPAAIEILKANGFQTVAELSVTPLEDLTAIEGMDAETARTVLEQARLHMEKYESA